MNATLPVLFTFRRCPYAIRARLALAYSGQPFIWREVVLKDKPETLLRISPKATVPVLLLPDGRVIDESRDIMLWALQQKDPQHWLGTGLESGLDDDPDEQNNKIDVVKADVIKADVVEAKVTEDISTLIDQNDNTFKANLDRYKYADRYPEHPASHYRAAAEKFVQQLEQRLAKTDHLMGNHQTLADVAIFPFIRQFAGVDPVWFEQAPYPQLRSWLQRWLQSELFLSVMTKYPRWNEGDAVLVFPQR